MSQTPPPANPQLLRALDHHRAGRTAEAAALYRTVVAAEPRNADALHLLGTIEAQSGNPAEGERLIAAALAINGGMALMWSNYGNVLGLLGRREEAIAAYDKAIALQPGFIEAFYNRANHLVACRRAGEALAGLDEVLARTPATSPARHILMTGRAHALVGLERYEDALAAYDAVLAMAARNVDAIAGRGNVLKQLGRHAEAIAAFDSAIGMVPGHLDAILGRAHAQVLLGAIDEPLAILDRVVAVQPANALAHYIRGHALLAALRTSDALSSFERAAALMPDFREAVFNVADTLRRLGRNPEAKAVYERLLAEEPGHPHGLTGLAEVAMQCCDWDTVRRIAPRVEDNVRAGTRGMMPFSFLSLSSSKELQLACAQNYTRIVCPSPPRVLTGQGQARARDAGKIRLGYLSSDFRRHAMAYQMAELFEIHDRARFEVIGLSAGPDDGSPVRQRIAKAFDQFHDFARLADADIARRIHEAGVDVAIDLNGHTAYSRIGALAWRPAPVQATYLGFPGTSGAPFIDYVIADATVAPFSDQPHFSEQIVHLSGCYQVSDRSRRAAATVPTRSAFGLPESGFVFACFNTSYKIAPEMFGVWMRILKALPGSVLWLVKSSEAMAGNLKRTAVAHGIDPQRLVFCGMVEPEAHIARHALADLFLDTLPYNSHGTGSFALWAGLPILTCLGSTFAGRVAGSMLRAIGLPELVTDTLADYEALALRLASDPALLAGLRRRLVAGRDTTALFDTDLFRRHIEAAYTTMHERAAAGEPPRAFAVAKLE